MAYAEVKGVIGGHIRFELLLPEAWNGRFLMGGGGGFVGTVQGVVRDSVNHAGTEQSAPGTGRSQLALAGWGARQHLEAQLELRLPRRLHRTEVAKAILSGLTTTPRRRIALSPAARGAVARP